MWQNKQTKKPYIICFHAFNAPSWCDSAACLIFSVFVAVVQKSPIVLGLTEKASTVVGSSPACSLCGAWGHPPGLPFQTGRGRPRPAWLQPVLVGAGDWGRRQLAEEKQLFVKSRIQFSGISVMLIKGRWPSAAPLLRVSLGWIRGLSVQEPWFYSWPESPNAYWLRKLQLSSQWDIPACFLGGCSSSRRCVRKLVVLGAGVGAVLPSALHSSVSLDPVFKTII